MLSIEVMTNQTTRVRRMAGEEWDKRSSAYVTVYSKCNFSYTPGQTELMVTVNVILNIFSLSAISKRSCCSLFMYLYDPVPCDFFSLQELQKSNITLKSISENLVDLIWTEGRPPLSNATIYPLELKFTG